MGASGLCYMDTRFVMHTSLLVIPMYLLTSHVLETCLYNPTFSCFCLHCNVLTHVILSETCLSDIKRMEPIDGLRRISKVFPLVSLFLFTAAKSRSYNLRWQTFSSLPVVNFQHYFCLVQRTPYTFIQMITECSIYTSG